MITSQVTQHTSEIIVGLVVPKMNGWSLGSILLSSKVAESASVLAIKIVSVPIMSAYSER